MQADTVCGHRPPLQGAPAAASAGRFARDLHASRNPRYAPALKALLAYYERTNNPDKAAEYRQRLAALGEDKAPK